MLGWKRKEVLAWQRSEFADLPVLRPDNLRVLQHWLVLAGGLALILSRATKDELENRFRCSEYLYQELRDKLSSRRVVLNIGADLLGETMHEIAGVADPMTIAAARACFAACLAAAKSTPAGLESRFRVDGGSPSSLRTTAIPSAKHESASTQVNLEVLMERSSKLRSAVAFARTTTFGNPEATAAKPH